MKRGIYITMALTLALFILAFGFIGSDLGGEPVFHTVTYISEGAEPTALTVEDGHTPESVAAPTQADAVFLGWADENGEAVSPETAAVTRDITYTALFGPRLREDEHAPYMFGDENGLFRPEDPFTRGDAAMALYALLAERGQPEITSVPKDLGPESACAEAAVYLVSAGLMDAPEGRFSPDAELDCAALESLLRHFFSAERVSEALEGADISESGVVARSQAAVCLNALLGRSGGGSPAGKVFFPDVDRDHPCRGDILEASVRHFYAGGESGEDWTWCEAPADRLKAGFVNLDGWLYCVERSGYFLTDGDKNGLHFGPDGRYTSGDAELDAYVADVIANELAESEDREDMLRGAYEYVRDSYTYLSGPKHKMRETGWVEDAAKTMFEHGEGNCYCYAGAFWAIARGLGYDASAISGTIGVARAPHAWVEIEFDGKMYIFDTEIEMTYIRDHKGPASFYMMGYDSGQGWSYRR